MITAQTKLCCIIGNPVGHSLSPQIHNAAYKALDLNYVFVALHVVDVKTAIAGLKAAGVAGIVVTVPHKIEALNYVDEADEATRSIGATNAIVHKNGKLIATNTDWTGALSGIEEKIAVRGKRVALLGAGGAARALAYGLKKRGARVRLFNRTHDGAQELMRKFQLDGAFSLTQTEKIRESDIIVNTTSVGMHPHEDASPIPADCIEARHAVFDAVYTPLHTKLLTDAQNKGATVITGDTMILYGAVGIFEFFTGKKAPFDTMKKAFKEAHR